MNRLDAGRNRQGPSNRPNNKRKRGQNGPENGPNRGVTGVRVIKAGPPPVDYTERYKPEYGCPLTSYVKGNGIKLWTADGPQCPDMIHSQKTPA